MEDFLTLLLIKKCSKSLENTTKTLLGRFPWKLQGKILTHMRKMLLDMLVISTWLISNWSIFNLIINKYKKLTKKTVKKKRFLIQSIHLILTILRDDEDKGWETLCRAPVVTWKRGNINEYSALIVCLHHFIKPTYPVLLWSVMDMVFWCCLI